MNIVISNLDSRTTNEDVRILFADYKELSVGQIKSIVQSHTGKLQTFAYVQIPDRETGTQLIAQYNKTEVAGNIITVKEAK